MNKFILLSIVTVITLGLGGYIINQYGSARYNTGYLEAEKKHLKTISQLNFNNSIELERLQNEVSDTSSNAIILELYNLGIVRDYTDR